jgi:hypothetical protein
VIFPHRCLRFILFLVGFLLIIGPVIAPVPAILTIEKYYFEKNGIPCNESIQFNITCYGHVCDGRDCRESTKDSLAKSGKMVQSGNCTGYGCSVYTTMPSYEPPLYSQCDLEGNTFSGAFSIGNYSQTPFVNCYRVNAYDYGGYYNFTPEYNQCMVDAQEEGGRCERLETPCNSTEKNCYRLSIGSYGKGKPYTRECAVNASLMGSGCPNYLMKLDPHTMIMWKSETGLEWPAEYLCEIHVVLPPYNFSMTKTLPDPQVSQGIPEQDQQTPALTFGKPAAATVNYPDPIESLYFSIVQMFGGRCE